MAGKDDSLEQLLGEVRACRLCEAELPLGPRPVLRAAPSARLMIIGQAPGTKVHDSGIPWNDASGERLRDWLQVTPEVFYDETKVAIIPMGFCYPGRLERGGDAPPRPECAPAWHPPLLERLPNVRLTLLIGQYAQERYLGPGRQKTLTETVRNFGAYGTRVIPLPHPSWRNTAWMKKNPWFEAELLPVLRARVKTVL
jgi:uracil-DNA glycosylase